ncbi:hypothetical protein SNEBB_002869 [Seison nebaliae]|nr:hypothetical protein SNEBB_002869 [Seison nebaliae]
METTTTLDKIYSIFFEWNYNVVLHGFGSKNHLIELMKGKWKNENNFLFHSRVTKDKPLTFDNFLHHMTNHFNSIGIPIPHLPTGKSSPETAAMHFRTHLPKKKEFLFILSEFDHRYYSDCSREILLFLQFLKTNQLLPYPYAIVDLEYEWLSVGDERKNRKKNRKLMEENSRNIRLIISMSTFSGEIYITPDVETIYRLIYVAAHSNEQMTEDELWNVKHEIKESKQLPLEGNSKLQSLRVVLSSVPPISRQIFILLCKHISENRRNYSTQLNEKLFVSIDEIFLKCREEFLVNTKNSFLQLIGEFEDHKVIEITKGSNGIDIILLLIDEQIIESFLTEQTL